MADLSEMSNADREVFLAGNEAEWRRCSNGAYLIAAAAHVQVFPEDLILAGVACVDQVADRIPILTNKQIAEFSPKRSAGEAITGSAQTRIEQPRAVVGLARRWARYGNVSPDLLRQAGLLAHGYAEATANYAAYAAAHLAGAAAIAGVKNKYGQIADLLAHTIAACEQAGASPEAMADAVRSAISWAMMVDARNAKR